MKILVTGAKGFIARNLIAELKNSECFEILEYDRETNPNLLDEYCEKAEFVFHLAGVNRPKEQYEFTEGNINFTYLLLDRLKNKNNKCPIMISSSVQANYDNPYGKSKKIGEDIIFEYSKETGADVLVYRFPNVFGKWSKPNYNSAVATFCYNIIHDLDITVNDRNTMMKLVYIDDVVRELINALNDKANRIGKYCEVPTVYTVTLGKIVDLIYSFKNSRDNFMIPNMKDSFTKYLYSTYLSYMPENKLNYKLKMHEDSRGSFTEFLKTEEYGQISVNISKPGITKGNHWHHSKNEKFLVVSGNAVIRFRKYGTSEIIEYSVCGDKLEVIDIPTGFTHSIQNVGNSDLVTIMWANECFDPKNPDTYYLEV